MPDYLQEADIPVYDQASCTRRWGRTLINDGHICVGGNNKGACNGDSGGPLICEVGGQYKLAGATSWGARDCPPQYPSVYTRVSYFR